MAIDPYAPEKLTDRPRSRYFVCPKCDRRETNPLPVTTMSHVCGLGPNKGQTTILTMIREGGN